MADFEKIKKLRAIMELSEAEHACLKSLMHCNMDHVEKFIKANKLGIKLEDVAGYYDFAIFGAGKKAVILTCDYLYENKNGKSGIKIGFDDLKDVLIEKHDLVLSYKNGKSMRMFASIYAEYYYDIISKILELNRQEQDEVVTNKTESLEVKKVPEKIVDKQAEAARLEEENKAKAETEDVQSWDASAHLKLCQQYCTEMNAIPGIPVGCGRLLREDEICKIAKSCKNAKRLNLKFGKEINNKELEAYLNGRHVCHKDSVLAFVDHGKQGAVLILKDSYNGNSLIYNSEDGKLSMFTFDALDYSIHGAYMEHDQLVVWNERHIRENFQLGTLGLSIAELLQKLLIAFFGVKDYEKIEAERLQRIEYRYQEICRRKEEAEAKAKAEAEAKAKEEEARIKAEEEARVKAETEARENAERIVRAELQIRESNRARVENRIDQRNRIMQQASARYRIVHDGVQRYRMREIEIANEKKQQAALSKEKYEQLLRQCGISDIRKENLRYEQMYIKYQSGRRRKPYKHSEENYGEGIRMKGLWGMTYCELSYRDNWQCGFRRKVDELLGIGKLDKLIDCGYPVAMYEKGYNLYHKGSPSDIREAKRLFENSIKHSTMNMPKIEHFCYVYSFYYLGRICEEGRGVDRDLASAVSFYQDTLYHIDKVDQDFMYFSDDEITKKKKEYQDIIRDCLMGIARNFVYTVVGYQDHRKQIQQFIDLLHGKDLLAVAKLVEPYLVDSANIRDVRQMYLSSKTDEGYMRAAQLYLIDADLADRGWIVMDKCINTGLEIKNKSDYLAATLWEQGVDLPKDLKRAYYAYKALALDEPMASYRLALMYRDGRGIMRDLDEARKYMKMAADAGVKEAQSALTTLEHDSVSLTDQARALECQGRMKEAMEIWHQAVLEQCEDINGERLADIWLEGKLVPRNTQYAVEARYVSALFNPVSADWKTLMHQVVDGIEMDPDYSLGLYCAKLALKWQSKQDSEAMYYREFCRLFLYVQKGMTKPNDFYQRLLKLLENLPVEQRQQQLKRLGNGVHGLEGMITCVKYMKNEKQFINEEQSCLFAECLTALCGWKPDRACLDVPSVAAEEAFTRAEILGNACNPDVKALCSAYEEAAALGHSEASRILITYFGNVKQEGPYPVPKDESWPAYTYESATWMALNGHAGAWVYMYENWNSIGGRKNQWYDYFPVSLKEELPLYTVFSALLNCGLWMLRQETSPRAICDLYQFSRIMYSESVRVKADGCIHWRGDTVSKPGVQAQEILKSVIQPGRMYAPACELAWSDHYAYVRGVDIQGELYYWEDQRKKAAHQAELAGYIGSVSRYEAERREEESIRQRNDYLLKLDQSVREEMRREQISREIAMEEAMEEKERLQEELRQEMEERRRQDEAMDKAERFFNMISGQGDWTNEELARMGRKSSDEMWTDERLRDMYRDKF